MPSRFYKIRAFYKTRYYLVYECLGVLLKQSQNKKGQKICLSCTKNGVFVTAGIWEKDIIFVVAQKLIFGPPYICRVPNHSLDFRWRLGPSLIVCISWQGFTKARKLLQGKIKTKTNFGNEWVLCNQRCISPLYPLVK